MKKRVLRDIRFYESEQPNETGRSLPGYLGKQFCIDREHMEYGRRIARRLENYGFSVGQPDHVYFNLTTALPPGSILRSPRIVDERIVYLDCGLDPAAINGQSADAMDEFIIDLVLRGLSILVEADPVAKDHLRTVEEEVRAHGSHLTILCKKKETKSYLVEIMYKIRPDNTSSVGIIRYTDKKTGQTGKTRFVDLFTYSDIYPITGTISVAKGGVTIKPRESFRASIHTERYRTPITIEIQEILKSEQGVEGDTVNRAP